MPAGETPYKETEALLAVLDEDDTKLEGILKDMSNHELTELRTAVSALRRLIMEEQVRRNL